MLSLPKADELASIRTRLANERTLLAYIRTAMAVLVTGLAVTHFSSESGTTALGWVLVLLSALILITGFVRFVRVRAAVQETFRGVEKEFT